MLRVGKYLIAGNATGKGRLLKMTVRSREDSTPKVVFDAAAMQAVLERKPEVPIPADFAAHMAIQAAQLSPLRTSRVPHYARLTALVVGFVVAVSLFALAPRTTASFGNAPFDIELLVLLHLCLLAWWFGWQTSRSS